MSKIKNLYLPGTNKNVGYLDGDTMHIYKRHRKYFLFPGKYSSDNTVRVIYVTKKEGDAEITFWMSSFCGHIFNIDTNMYEFFKCEFEIADNLDVIEMAYLYKHWKAKKNG
jgi:hypothetical protein